MPYSDNPPAYVIPDTYEWRMRSIGDVTEIKMDGGDVRYCPDYKRERRVNDHSSLVYNLYHPECYPCGNVNPMGERNHNWCYRCSAGLVVTQLHIYDAERTRDRAIRL